MQCAVGCLLPLIHTVPGRLACAVHGLQGTLDQASLPPDITSQHGLLPSPNACSGGRQPVAQLCRQRRPVACGAVQVGLDCESSRPAGQCFLSFQQEAVRLDPAEWLSVSFRPRSHLPSHTASCLPPMHHNDRASLPPCRPASRCRCCRSGASATAPPATPQVGRPKEAVGPLSSRMFAASERLWMLPRLPRVFVGYTHPALLPTPPIH